MNVKRAFAAFLSLAMLFGAVAPSFAQQHAVSEPAEHGQLVLPLGDELSDEQLAETRGQLAPWLIGGISGGITYGLATKDQKKDIGWVARGLAAIAVGGITAGTGSALMATATTTAAKVAVGTYTTIKGAIVEYALVQDGSH